tara:strand:- start:559 stop:765 length:207 start_codon:yes stop_codon:yes gene_type:complete
MKLLMIDFNELEYDDKIDRFEEILKYVFDNKILLKNKKFKLAVIEKIDKLKNMNEILGFYWGQKIFCE